MICPLTRITGNTAGISCKPTCAWWDEDANQCQEVTKTQMLVEIEKSLARLAGTLQHIQGLIDYGDRKAVIDQT